MKKIYSILLITLLSFTGFAQEIATTPKRFLDDPFNDPLLPIYLLTLFVFVVVFLVGFVAVYLFRILNMLADQAEKEKAQKAGIEYTPKPTIWDNFINLANASVPIEREKDIELEHNYDGIKELDNHLPPWWKWLFYACIAWGVVYMVVYHITDTFPLQIEEYQNAVSLSDEQARKLKASRPQEVIDENMLAFSNDKVLIEKGKAVFASYNCAQCHKSDGGGNMIGPNLTDEYWIHGGSIKNIFTTIKVGVIDKGMPEWGKSMSPQDLKAVSFFVMSLKGTNPVGAKAAQGQLYKEEVVKSDSTTVKMDSTTVRASL